MNTVDDKMDLDNDNICGVCYAEFLDDDDLKLHVTQYHLNETNKSRFCKFCSKIYSDVWSFVIHFRNYHLITFRICKYCTRVFNNDESLSEHEKKHKRSLCYPKISCSQCKKVFKDNKEVENHEYERHRDSDDGMLLQYCYPEFSAVIHFNARKFFHSIVEHFMYSCVVCDLSTVDVIEYVKHLQTKKCRSYSCNVCCNTYPWKSRLESHCKSHQKLKDTVSFRVRKCPKCDKYFQPSKLRTHLKECKSMKCAPCDMLFDSVDTFAIHISTHCQRNLVQFENCKYCRRPFIAPTQLKKHIERAHTHNIHLYKYCCIYCDILFKHPKQLFGHFFSKHRDINPYTCKICNKGFRIRKNFTLHIKLDHKSVGFVEFDSNYHVFFTEKKSEKPFQPKNPYLADLSDKNSNEGIDKETTVNKELSSDDNIYKGTSSHKKNTHKTSEKNETTTHQENTINIKDNVANNTETSTDKFEDKTDNLNETTNEKTTSETDTKISETTNAALIDQENQPIGKKDLEVLKGKTAQKSDPKTTKDEVHNNNKLIEVDDKTPAKNIEMDIEIVNVDSDSMDITEAKGDNDNRRVQKRKHKSQIDKPRKRSKIKSQSYCDTSDSDVPLSKIVHKSKKGRRWKVMKRNKNTKDASISKKTKFICSKCERNCYTYQNYHRHMNLHTKNGEKVCVKCFAKFETKEELNNHMKTEHSSSELTDTLKKLLDKRKSSVTQKTKSPENMFLKTIHKVQFEASATQATMTKVSEDKLSVKKFLETFKPDANDGTSKKISIANSLSIRPVTTARTEPIIKMNKFKEEPEQQTTHRPQLRMPVKFKEEPAQDIRASMKMVNCEYVAPTVNFDNEVTVFDDNEDHIETDNIQNETEVIPEVGREILVEESHAHKPKVLKKTIDLKDLMSYHNVSIGHLAPQAPFYKIVKIDEVLQDKQKKVEPSKEINITLPNGTKLVSVNPLAHLLSNKTVADIPKSSTYNKKPKNNKDFKEAILKAMEVLEKTPPKRKSVKKTVVSE